MNYLKQVANSVDQCWDSLTIGQAYTYGTCAASSRRTSTLTLQTEYVVHSSTMCIPCAVDTSFLRKRGFQNVVCFDHSDCGSGCKLVPNRKADSYCLSQDCPCRSKDDKGHRPKELCYPAARRMVARGELNWKQVQFCYDHADLFGMYPKIVQEKYKLKSWREISTHEELMSILCLSDWARLGNGCFAKLKAQTIAATKVFGITETKARLKRAIVSASGIITKLHLMFPNTEFGYVQMCKYNAQMVFKFADDYYGFTNCTFFDGVKDMAKGFAKLWQECIDFDVVYESFEDILGVQAAIFKDELGERFTPPQKRTVEWHNFTAMLIQGRVLSYLPSILREKRKEEFIRDLHYCEPTSESVLKQVRMGLNYRLNSQPRPNIEPEAYLDFKLKPRSALTVPCSAGGKIEELRQILSMCREDNLVVKARDLSDGSDKYDVPVPNEVDGAKEYLFWLAIEVCEVYTERVKPRSKVLLCFARMLPYMVLNMIDEPGKLRPLTGGTALSYVLLAPMTFMLKACMVCMYSHSSGLCGAEHAYMHELKLGRTTTSYYGKDSVRTEGFYHVFSDWKDASNWVARNLGAAVLREACDVFELPEFYCNLCIEFCERPYNVNIGGTTVQMMHMWPMGISLTKYVLHLIHEGSHGIVQYALARKGVREFPVELSMEGHSQFPRKECLERANPETLRSQFN